eukprot:jgi/Mesvir1/3837/Mv19802-RA.1
MEKWDVVTKHIPPSVIRECKGICFLHEDRVGFGIVSAIGSNGFLLAKLPLGASEGQAWSGPVSVYSTGMGLGAEIGGSETYKLLVFNDVDALHKFGSSKFDIGLSAGIAAGPVGREVDATAHVGGLRAPTSTFAYSISQGVLLGATLDVSRISKGGRSVSSAINKAFYGKDVDPAAALKALYEGLAVAAGTAGNGAEAVVDPKKSP